VAGREEHWAAALQPLAGHPVAALSSRLSRQAIVALETHDGQASKAALALFPVSLTSTAPAP
jgi:hypothetical protein